MICIGDIFYHNVIPFFHRYECDPGYERSGLPVLLCQSNGTWSSAVPTCSRMRCYDFPPLDNGYIKDSDREYYYGDTARAECFKGYNMIGNNVLTCSEDQTFAGVPTCEDKDECAQGQVRAVFFGLFFALNGD